MIASNQIDPAAVRDLSGELNLVGALVEVATVAAGHADPVTTLTDGFAASFKSSNITDDGAGVAVRVATAIAPVLTTIRDDKFRQLSAAMGHEIVPPPAKSKPHKIAIDCGYGHAGEDREAVIRAAIAARRTDPDLPAADHKQSDGEVLANICAGYLASRNYTPAANSESV
ncbi:MAG TPA: hypothetical protein VGE52_08165 [Pirellulales bacterium]